MSNLDDLPPLPTSLEQWSRDLHPNATPAQVRE
jgi:hypothetical protein